MHCILGGLLLLLSRVGPDTLSAEILLIAERAVEVRLEGLGIDVYALSQSLSNL